MSAQRPLPSPTPETQPFWQAARQHRLVIQRCTACTRFQHYPRPFCVHCLSEALEWVASPGRGVIYTFTINHRAANPAMSAQVPYAVLAVDLDEGVRMIGNLAGDDLSRLRIGARVVVAFEDVAETVTLPQFRLEGADDH